jgi:ATP-dependent RNA circularization protein (DNA/RNA ligase family)
MSESNNVYKYPRTFHLPQSETISSDDKKAGPDTLAYLGSGIELIVTEKMDGGNVTMMRDFFYSRSLDSGTHSWDTPAKAIHARIAHEIPEKWRISGESLYARRSVSYDNLPGPFVVFGIWDETNTLLSWDEMVEWAELFELPVVPILYRGNDFKEAVNAWGKVLNSDVSEGYVVRDSGRIAYDDFNIKVAKYVRFNHVRTDAKWRGRDDFDLNTFV